MSQALPQPPPGSPPEVAYPPILTPLPTDAATIEAARNYLAREIGMNAPASREAETDLIERIDGLMAAASALVEREAPSAPQAVRNEAVVRMAGYLRQSDYGGIRREGVGEGARDVEYVTTHAGAFRRSGAKALLSPWKRRRAL